MFHEEQHDQAFMICQLGALLIFIPFNFEIYILNNSEFMDYRKKVMSALLPAMLFTAVATTLSSVSVNSCAYATMESSYLSEKNIELDIYRDVGLWGYAGYSDLDSSKTDTSECYEYPDDVRYDDNWEVRVLQCVVHAMR